MVHEFFVLGRVVEEEVVYKAKADTVEIFERQELIARVALLLEFLNKLNQVAASLRVRIEQESSLVPVYILVRLQVLKVVVVQVREILT